MPIEGIIRYCLVEQELLTLPEHLSSPPVFSEVRVTRSLVLFVCFVDRCLSFCPSLVIVLSVLRFTDSDHHFIIFKLPIFPMIVRKKSYLLGVPPLTYSRLERFCLSFCIYSKTLTFHLFKANSNILYFV
jgi:hypothetical protein